MPDIDYSAASLRAFADDLRNTSRMPARAAGNLAVCIRAILNGLDLADDLDMRAIDREELLARFTTAEAGHLTPHTLQTYRAGFRRGLDMFLRRQANDSDWDAPASARRRRGRTTVAADSTRFVSHTFPLRAGITVRLTLPIDLTTIEADRLTAFVKSLVLHSGQA